MRWSVRAWSWGLWCALWACGGARTPAPAPPSPARPPAPVARPAADAGAPASRDAFIEKGDIAQLDARELAPMAKHPLSAGKLTGEVESTSAPVVRESAASTRFDIPIGAGTDVQCFVYPKAIDAGGQLLALVKGVSKTVDVQVVAPTDAAVVGEYAALFIEVRYTIKTAPGERAAGLVKAAVYPHALTPLLCLHDEVGYRRTFKRVVLGLAASLKLDGVASKPSRFVDLFIERIDGRATGFSRSEVFDGDHGTQVYESSSTSLMPRAATELSAEDIARTEVWDPTGHVATVSFAESEGGDLSEQMNLTRTSGHQYTYEGIHLGKKISGKLQTRDPKGFETDAHLDQAVKKLLVRGGSLQTQEYHPDIDPTAPLDIVLRPVSSAARTLTMEVGKTKMTVTVDADGRPEKMEMPVSSSTLTMERVFVRGAP